jgi:hypothetical protein
MPVSCSNGKIRYVPLSWGVVGIPSFPDNVILAVTGTREPRSLACFRGTFHPLKPPSFSSFIDQ